MTAALYSDAAALARTALVGVLACVALILLLRASGKRTLSKMNAFARGRELECKGLTRKDAAC